MNKTEIQKLTDEELYRHYYHVNYNLLNNYDELQLIYAEIEKRDEKLHYVPNWLEQMKVRLGGSVVKV